MKQIKRNQGFTLIELMAVIAIISILAVLAISTYSNYAIRSKVAEGLGFAAAAKTSVTEAYYTTGQIPINNDMAGLSPPDSYDFLTYVSRLEVSSLPVPGVITVTIKIPTLGANNRLQLVPTTVGGEMEWECKPDPVNGIATSRVPSNCRG